MTRKIFFFIYIALLLSGCKKEEDGRIKIGIIQIVEHPSLDAAYKGFIDGLKENAPESDFSFDYQNAQGEQSNCPAIANKLVSAKVKLILAIGTPASQASANLTKTIPIIASCVSDPVGAKLASSLSHPGGNVTGVSDYIPAKSQLELIKKLLPKAQTVGLLYSSGEQNSYFQIEKAKEECAALNLKWVEAAVTATNELQQATLTLCQKTDAIYAPSDNMIASSMTSISAVATEQGKAVFPAAVPMVKEGGGLATCGIDYYELGRKSADMALRILLDGEHPSSMPIEFMENKTVAVNEETAKRLGIDTSVLQQK